MNYEKILTDLAIRDERFIIMTAENRALIRNIPNNEKLKSRFIDTGITEQALIGSAAGFAIRGRIPVVHILATFMTMRAFEFIRTDIGIPKLNVKLTGFVPGFLSEANGPTHQAIEDVALMHGIPNMNVFCPADEDDMLIGLEKVLLSPEPTYIRCNNRKSNYQHSSNFEIGRAEIISEGKDIVILTYGTLFSEVYEAKNILYKKGYSTGLINTRFLKPFDEQTILSIIKPASFIVTVEDHLLNGGIYSLICEMMVKNQIIKPVLPIGLNDRWFKPALLKDVLEYEGFTSVEIARRIEEWIYKLTNDHKQAEILLK